ncbi:MAG: hypothetical protein E6R03_09430 [Hyphomicrobiaceae bacterium]|nr:MAG: hypothetical protein E6R03_09430 [Hyphomicrobiaceae bacterium]
MKPEQPPLVDTRVSIPGRVRGSRGKYFGHIKTVEGNTIHFVDVDNELIPCKKVIILPKDCL